MWNQPWWQCLCPQGVNSERFLRAGQLQLKNSCNTTYLLVLTVPPKKNISKTKSKQFLTVKNVNKSATTTVTTDIVSTSTLPTLPNVSVSKPQRNFEIAERDRGQTRANEGGRRGRQGLKTHFLSNSFLNFENIYWLRPSAPSLPASAVLDDVTGYTVGLLITATKRRNFTIEACIMEDRVNLNRPINYKEKVSNQNKLGVTGERNRTYVPIEAQAPYLKRLK